MLTTILSAESYRNSKNIEYRIFEIRYIFFNTLQGKNVFKQNYNKFELSHDLNVSQNSPGH